MNKFQVTIGEKIQQPIPPSNVFKLVIDFMHGDADQYTSEDITFDADDDICQLEQTIALLEHISTLPTPAAGGDSYSSNENWEDLLGDVWPRDLIYYETEAAFDGYHVEYFNGDGVAHSVSVTPCGDIDAQR